jgi:hypothetical protein
LIDRELLVGGKERSSIGKKGLGATVIPALKDWTGSVLEVF